MDVDKEIRDIKRRPDLAETRMSQMDGRFEFITGQLRDIQLYMHARFGDIDGRLNNVEARLDRMDAKIDALPRAVAELIARRD